MNGHRLRLVLRPCPPLLPLILLAFVVVALLGPSSAGAAKRHPLVSKDGRIHACYKVKGKPRGALRVVRSRKARCRKGERRVAWSVMAISGAPGISGTQGSPGQSGAAGGSVDETVLKEQVETLLQRVAALEAVLNGITNADLLGAVAAVPAVEALCAQAPELVDQVNEVGAGLSGLVSILNGTILGPIFGGVGVPAALDPFSCPTS